VGLTDITRDSVLAAVAECDELGRDAFVASYGFQRARKYVLLHDGKTYDSKALVGAAHRHATGDPLPAAAFGVGERTVVARLTALGFDVRDTSGLTRAGDRGTIGDAPGVEEGQTFADRQETYDRGAHRALQAGIVGTARTGAESIVVSGGYEDDEDYNWLIIYTGHGGRDAGRQIANQSLDSPGNAALKTSMLTGAPVRVIRGAHRGSPHAPESGYRYDGLFRVADAWREQGRSGFLVCRFKLIKLDSPAIDAQVEPVLRELRDKPSEPPGNEAPGHRSTTSQRLVRSIEVAEYVKTLHDHTCQACGTRLTVGPRGYSEAAHIRALGRPHAGPDVPSNVLCLCPNCHVLFDSGALVVRADLQLVLNDVALGKLRTHPSHIVAEEHLDYHRSIHL
jgi:putative restriction endonuclease